VLRRDVGYCPFSLFPFRQINEEGIVPALAHMILNSVHGKVSGATLSRVLPRILKMSGAADIIMQWMEDGDDSDFPHVYIASSDFCDILAAKLLLSGRAFVL
jgi:hypothetical protein